MSSRLTIFGSITVGIAFVMELTLVPLLLPAIQEQFNLSIGQLAWVFNSYGIAVAIGVLLAGWLGDTFNTKKVFGAGVLLFALGSSLVAFAGSYESVLFGRAVQGLGGGIFSPLVPILLTKATPQRPGRMLIIWGGVTGYVAACAPLIYSSLLTGYGWRLAFIIFAIVSLVAVVIVHRSHLKDDTAPKAEARPSYSTLFASRELWMMFVYVFCTYGSITYYLFRLPLWLSENQFQVISVGFVLSTLWISFSVLSTLLRNQVDGKHVRTILLIAPVLILCGFPLAYLSQHTIVLALSAILVGSGLACSNAPSTQMILKFAPKGMSAASTSLDITFARIGGVAIVTLLAQSMFLHAFVVVFVLCAIALICALTASPRIKDSF